MTSPRQLPTHSVQFPIISLILAFSSQSHSTVVRGKIPSETYLLLMLTKPIPQKSLGKTLSFLILVVTLFLIRTILTRWYLPRQALGCDSVHGNLCLL